MRLGSTVVIVAGILIGMAVGIIIKDVNVVIRGWTLCLRLRGTILTGGQSEPAN